MGKHSKRHALPLRKLAASGSALAVVGVGGMMMGTGTASAALDAHQAHVAYCESHAYTPASCAALRPSGSAVAAEIAAYAKRYAGYRYVYGGTSPSGFDCSGFAQYVYAHFGLHIDRTSDEQYREFRHTSSPLPGDLVFFLSDGASYHTGIYLGGGEMISALSEQYGVKITPLSWGGSHYAYGTITH